MEKQEAFIKVAQQVKPTNIDPFEVLSYYVEGQRVVDMLLIPLFQEINELRDLAADQLILLDESTQLLKSLNNTTDALSETLRTAAQSLEILNGKDI